MSRKLAVHPLPYLAMALSFGLLACSSSSSGTPNVPDGAADIARDTQGADRTDTAASETRDVATDRADVAPDVVPDAPADHVEAGGDTQGTGGVAGTGGNGASDSGVGGTGAGGHPDGLGGNGAGGIIGTGGNGSGGVTAGTGGNTSGLDGGTGATDAGSDASGGSADDGGGTVDVPVDSSSTPDAPSDSGPACGAGCPANVQPQSLLLWISADVGVTCDQGTPSRITSWQDRRGGSAQTLMPGLNKVGPRCDGMTLAGTALPYFDRTTADIDNGVLRLDLTPLNGKSYTVFVVERRRTADARYILGTDVPVPVISACADETTGLNPNAHLAYRLGYKLPTVFSAGSYTVDDQETCQDPAVLVPAFSTPAAMLEVERLVSGTDHSMSIAGTTNSSDSDFDPMNSLLQGYLGRAYNLPASADSRYLGEVAEVVIYSVALSPSDVTAVSAYLSSRWSL